MITTRISTLQPRVPDLWGSVPVPEDRSSGVARNGCCARGGDKLETVEVSMLCTTQAEIQLRTAVFRGNVTHVGMTLRCLISAKAVVAFDLDSGTAVWHFVSSGGAAMDPPEPRLCVCESGRMTDVGIEHTTPMTHYPCAVDVHVVHTSSTINGTVGINCCSVTFDAKK